MDGNKKYTSKTERKTRYLHFITLIFYVQQTKKKSALKVIDNRAKAQGKAKQVNI